MSEGLNERERGKPRITLLTVGNKLMVTKGEVDEGVSERGDAD